MKQLKPSKCSEAIEYAASEKQPIIIWGSPGISKSQVAAQTARRLGYRCQDVRAALLDPVDLRGIPYLKDGRTLWGTPGFLPQPTDPKTMLLLDEMNRAPVMVQNALFQLAQDRRIGEYTLPDDCIVVSCCNRESDGGGVVKMPQALSNRFLHVEMVVDLDDWCKWAISADIEPAVIGFLRFRPDLLHQFSRTDRAFPTPRSWEFVSKITKRKPGNGVEHALYCGSVGEGAGTEYSAFLRLFRELPNIDAIRLDPDHAPVPKQPATLFAVAAAIARRMTVDSIGAFLRYLARMSAEFSVYAVQDAVRRDQTLKATPEFTKWAIANAEVVF